MKRMPTIAAAMVLSFGVSMVGTPVFAAGTHKIPRSVIRVSCQGPAKPRPNAGEEKRRQYARSQRVLAKLKQAVEKAVRADPDRATLRIMVQDETDQVWCGYQQRKSVITRSVTKVAIAAALLRQHERDHTKPSHAELVDIHKAISRSSNAAGQRMFNALGDGVSAMRTFYRIAGMRDAYQPSPKGRWGNVHTSPADQIALLRLLTDGSDKVLDNSDKQLILGYMRTVVKGQRWGVAQGTPTHASVAIKNGWGPSSTEPGYIVNSIGSVTTGALRYNLVVMTNHNPTEPAGMRRTSRVSRPINQAIAAVA